MSGIIRYASLSPARWANGGGVTRQIAAGSVRDLFPAGGTVAGTSDGTAGGTAGGDVDTAPPGTDWDWRISIAEVATEGPFSSLPGIDRILTIIDGELIALTVDGTERALEKYRPFRFSGDSVTSATLPTGPLTDLNLMTRRGACTGYAAIVELSRKRAHPVSAGQFAVLLHGDATVTTDATNTDPTNAAHATNGAAGETLGRLDTVTGSHAAPAISGRGFLAILGIDPA